LDCNEAIHEIYHYLDGELTEEKRRIIAHHLQLCPPCAGPFDFYAELRILIARKCRDDVPPELRQRIAQAIGHEPSPGEGAGSIG
jgi:mycothiol system anti-sigma-R factor